MLNKKTLNAIEICVCITKLQHHLSCSTGQLSKTLGLSVSYIEMILRQLKARGVVCAFRGPGGGYKILGDIAQVRIWDIARIFEEDTSAQSDSHASPVLDCKRGLQEVVKSTLCGFTLADFAEPLSHQPHVEDHTNRFKFKPMAAAWVPNAPNSVFQLHMHS